MTELFLPHFDWTQMMGEETPAIAKQLKEIKRILTVFGRHGISDDLGQMYQPEEYIQFQNEREFAIEKAAHEFRQQFELGKEAGGGFITPGFNPKMFDAGPKYKGSKEYEPDTSYLDWMVQTRMVQEVEERREWDANINFVRMDKAGQVEYGDLASTEQTMYNYEWGAGIKIYTTWFETNMFGIRMSRLAPKFRYQYFDQIADAVYVAAVAAWTTALGSTTQNVIRDLNTACNELRRVTNTFGKSPWDNASFRIVAPPEARWYIDAALAMSYALLSREQLTQRMSVTYTSKLAANSAVYVIVDRWEQNELGVRVPFTVYGNAKDIDTFAEKVSYRGAYGLNIDGTSARSITFDPANASFVIGGPIGMRTL